MVASILLVAACGDRSDIEEAVGDQVDEQIDEEVEAPDRSEQTESSATGSDGADDDPEAPDADDPAAANDAPASDGPAAPVSDADDGAEAEDNDRTPVVQDTGPTTVEPVFLFPVAEGDSGDAVRALQSRLANLGFAPGTPDGSYGRRTTKAVAAFQRLVDLEETGEADADTVAALTTYYYDGIILVAGDKGDEVETLQQRLADGPFDPGPIDGEYGTTTVQAVWALEKLAGMPVDGNWGPLDEKAWEMLHNGEIGKPAEDHDERWVEVSLTEQLVKVYDPGETTPTLISHVSSGSGVPWSNEEYSGSSITPTGEFEISRRIRGWRESSLNIGRLYNPLYFNGGIAFHGATSVPLYPASHGCIRVPMHVAEYLPEELPNGTTVHVDA